MTDAEQQKPELLEHHSAEEYLQLLHTQPAVAESFQPELPPLRVERVLSAHCQRSNPRYHASSPSLQLLHSFLQISFQALAVYRFQHRHQLSIPSEFRSHYGRLSARRTPLLYPLLLPWRFSQYVAKVRAAHQLE